MTIRGYKPRAKQLWREVPDGLNTARKTSVYRTNFKDALICRSMNGLGHSLRSAGKEFCEKSALDARDIIGEWELTVSPRDASQDIVTNTPRRRLPRDHQHTTLATPSRAPMARQPALTPARTALHFSSPLPHARANASASQHTSGSPRDR